MEDMTKLKPRLHPESRHRHRRQRFPDERRGPPRSSLHVPREGRSARHQADRRLPQLCGRRLRAGLWVSARSMPCRRHSKLPGSTRRRSTFGSSTKPSPRRRSPACAVSASRTQWQTSTPLGGGIALGHARLHRRFPHLQAARRAHPPRRKVWRRFHVHRRRHGRCRYL